jgi:hypothetical protein
MASSSNTTWIKGFSGNPDGEARGEGSVGKLLSDIGSEWVTFPAGSDDALRMTRREALARTLWTRGVIDGDMTAIKLLVELLEGKGTAAGEAGSAGPALTADHFAAAEAEYRAWAAQHCGGGDVICEEAGADGLREE